MAAAMTPENGMDIKTLSAMLVYVSAATTPDSYTRITGEMQGEAAAKAVPAGTLSAGDVVHPKARHRVHHGTQRPPLRGALLPHLAGRHEAPKCVCAHTREACEEKLKVLTQQMNAE